MYSGTTLRTKSGRIMGAHQRIDRVAKRHLRHILPRGAFFPTIREILKFEGLGGPDGIKRKSPGRDEPWHFIDPADHSDTKLLTAIDDHMTNLVRALAGRDQTRAAFEAAWLAHAIVDGLTPAHHFPFEARLEELRGEGMETRTSIRSKVLLPGTTNRQRIKNNWDFWGAKGVMTTHTLFEFGFATTLSSMKLDGARPSADQLIRIKTKDYRQLYLEQVRHIYALGLYDTFQKKGWTGPLATKVRRELVPVIVRMVTLAWYQASLRAEAQRSGEPK
ncbi:MAG TPA: hypothetical protein VF597_01105 [Candidatus Saccharimonadales bacterium]|jgi:hypothetical protein